MSEYQGLESKAALKNREERACAQLLGVISGITADGQLHNLEIQFLKMWLAENQRAGAHWLGRRIAAKVEAVLADGHISDEERAELWAELQSASGIEFASTGCAAPDTIAFPGDECEVNFNEATVCLTGKFEFGSRGQCEAATMAAGATCVGDVTKKVNYLVIGSAGATASWKQATYGAKIDAAMKLKEKGHRIFILDEAAWRTGLRA